MNAELATSKVSLDQATASHDAGISPRLDVLRAQVDYQNEQQSLISATNQLAKDKLALARVIGLPLDQAYTLTDSEPSLDVRLWDPASQLRFAAKRAVPPRPDGAPNAGQGRDTREAAVRRSRVA